MEKSSMSEGTIVGYIRRNNGVKGPGYAEWDEPVFRLDRKAITANPDRHLAALKEIEGLAKAHPYQIDPIAQLGEIRRICEGEIERKE